MHKRFASPLPPVGQKAPPLTKRKPCTYMYMYTHGVPLLPLSDDETLLSSSDLEILSPSFPSEPLPLPPLAPPTAVVPPVASGREGLPDSVVLLEEGMIRGMHVLHYSYQQVPTLQIYMYMYM